MKIRISKQGYVTQSTILKLGQDTPTIRLKKRRNLKRTKPQKPALDEKPFVPDTSNSNSDILNKKELPAWN